MKRMTVCMIFILCALFALAGCSEPRPNIELRGITYDSTGECSAAFLRTPSAKTDSMYAIGDRIDGWEIVEISTTRVVLKKKSKTAILRLSDSK